MKFVLTFLILLLSVSETKEYSQKIASRMVQLSQAIYSIPETDLKDNLCNKCYEDYKVTKLVMEDEVLGMVGYDQKIKSIVVVFRGSDNMHNWKTDFDLKMVPYPENPVKCKDCKVHQGFYKTYKLLKGEIQEALQQLIQIKPSYGVIFTGHSLGGAIDNLIAISFKQHYPNKSIQIYNFGQPQVGNDNYAKFVDQEIDSYFRVIYKRDLIPHLPGDSKGYRHSGTEIWYKNGMLRRYKQCKAQSKDCSNSLGKENYDQTLNDHQIKYYAQIILKVK